MPTLPPNTRFLSKEGIEGLSFPLHIQVRSANARKVSKWIKSHCFSVETVRGSFVKAQEGYYVASPENCFFQMAGVLGFVELLELAYEFCGEYLPAANDKGFVEVKPLTTVSKLLGFAKQMRGAHGRKLVMKVLKYVQDSSASPMETKLTIQLILPYRYGGFGFKMPKLNKEFTVKQKAYGKARVHKRSQSDDHVPIDGYHEVQQSNNQDKMYKCDLYWKEAKLVVEYDSNAHHTGIGRITKDSKKRSDLSLLGIDVISVTYGQVKTVTEVKKLAHVLAKKLGKVLRYEEQKFTVSCFKLQRALLC